MSTKDNGLDLTPEEMEERRRRREARKKRREMEKQKARKRKLIIGGSILGAVILTLIIFLIIKLVSGSSSTQLIKAEGDTVTIVIDPGHGGEDLGMSSDAGLEKDMTMEICSKLEIMLESQGYTVVMTREDDTRVSREDRVTAANAANADLLVSVHGGYSETNPVLTGCVSHYKTDSPESRGLAEQIQAYLSKENGSVDGGTKEGDFSIISDTEMPAVLVEVGYISNDEEAENLMDDAYQNDTAKGIAKGIIKSLDIE